MCPKDVLDAIAYAELAGNAGTFAYSTTYLNSAWLASPLAVAAAPEVEANQSDNKQKEADANQWNLQRLTWNDDASIPPPRLFRRRFW